MTDLEKAARAALEAIQGTLEDAYHRCSQECCGRLSMDCCGNPNQVWSAEDNRIMGTLGPVEKNLRAALAADTDAADARRYRWLRERSIWRSDPPCVVIQWAEYEDGLFQRTTYKANEALDAAIDAAMAEQEGSKHGS